MKKIAALLLQSCFMLGKYGGKVSVGIAKRLAFLVDIKLFDDAEPFHVHALCLAHILVSLKLY